MEKVKLSYRVMGLLWVKDKLLLLPQHTGECSLEQLKKLSAYWLIDQPDYVTQLKVVAILLNISHRFLLRIDPESLNRLRELSLWVFEECSFTEKKLDSFSLNSKTFYAPDTCLFNCSFIEFIHADEMAQQYALSGEEKYLDALVATLFRPAKSKKQLNADDYNGDIRRPYNYYLSQIYAKEITGLDQALKKVVFLFFAGCKKYISEQFPEVFGAGGESDSAELSNSDSPYAVAQKLLAKEGTLGDLEKVQDENLYNALSMLKDIILNIEKQNS
ncbi:hypothetical protein [Chondrinema litorale]|uniref:hypothetical protein n=1 Tax=Chondrinema litorale TaxID=2994555 RepID=UPI002542B969|nr:hypothetical protein [Chondrinema litorale]UZR93131.1 hypothetical protein OQ292_14825 [Chondrinema litorale]